MVNNMVFRWPKPVFFMAFRWLMVNILLRSHSQNQIPLIPLSHPLVPPSAVKVALPKVEVQGALLINLPKGEGTNAVFLFDEA